MKRVIPVITIVACLLLTGSNIYAALSGPSDLTNSLLKSLVALTQPAHLSGGEQYKALNQIEESVLAPETAQGLLISMLAARLSGFMIIDEVAGKYKATVTAKLYLAEGVTVAEFNLKRKSRKWKVASYSIEKDQPYYQPVYSEKSEPNSTYFAEKENYDYYKGEIKN